MQMKVDVCGSQVAPVHRVLGLTSDRTCRLVSSGARRCNTDMGGRVRADAGKHAYGDFSAIL